MLRCWDSPPCRLSTTPALWSSPSHQGLPTEPYAPVLKLLPGPRPSAGGKPRQRESRDEMLVQDGTPENRSVQSSPHLTGVETEAWQGRDCTPSPSKELVANLAATPSEMFPWDSSTQGAPYPVQRGHWRPHPPCPLQSRWFIPWKTSSPPGRQLSGLEDPVEFRARGQSPDPVGQHAPIYTGCAVGRGC